MPSRIESITISPDSKNLTVVVSAIPTSDKLTYYNYTTDTTEESGTIASDANDILTWNITSTALGEDFNGVISITLDSTGISSYAVGTAEIDCCIAGLVERAITCTCQCDRCDEDLKTAQKISLLVQGAKHATYSSANITDAINKYNKAKAFCTATCACGC
jgi:hypothetical protein